MEATRQTTSIPVICVTLIVVAFLATMGQSVLVQSPEAQEATPNLQVFNGARSNSTEESQKTPGVLTAPAGLAQGTAQEAAHKPATNADKKVLVIDIGGTSVKILATGQAEPRRFPSGPRMTPARMVSGVKEFSKDWVYEVVSIGYPGRVQNGNVVSDPYNLAPGWIGFDFQAAFDRPVKVINDAAMQALGSYKSGTLLFLGLGTGLGSALVVEGFVVPMELGHLSYKDGTYEDYVGNHGLERLGQEEWAKHVDYVVARLIEAFHADDVVLGGGNVEKLKKLPLGCRAGSNANAFLGGFRLWSGP